VRRSGGLAGVGKEGAVDLEGSDDRVDELRALVGRIDVADVPGGEVGGADRFVYDFDLCGDRCRVPELLLTPDLRRVVELVLR
ncbi:protealysin inhibitor emfourin, partial [Nocardioides sp. CER28]